MSTSTIRSIVLTTNLNKTIMDYASVKLFSLNGTFVNISPYNSLHRFVIRCLSIYALILVIIGTLGNLLTIIILCRRNLRRYVTMRYLIAVSITDLISLYGWNLNNFYKFTISSKQNNLEELSLIHCRLISYVSFVGLQLSSWCLAAVSLDRCLSLYFLTWKQTYGKLSRTKYYISILTITCLLLNSHILFFNGYHTDSSVKCYATRQNPYYIFPQWERIHLIVYNLCPFIIMLSCNIYIILITIRSSRIRTTIGKSSHTNKTRHRQLSFMLMLVTFVFVLLTLPSCIYFVFFRHRMSSENSTRTYRYMIQICLSSVQFTSHAINFFLYCFSATNFRNELKDFMENLCCYCRIIRLKSTKQTSTTTTTIKLTTFPKNKMKFHSTCTTTKIINDAQTAFIDHQTKQDDQNSSS